MARLMKFVLHGEFCDGGYSNLSSPCAIISFWFRMLVARVCLLHISGSSAENHCMFGCLAVMIQPSLHLTLSSFCYSSTSDCRLPLPPRSEESTPGVLVGPHPKADQSKVLTKWCGFTSIKLIVVFLLLFIVRNIVECCVSVFTNGRYISSRVNWLAMPFPCTGCWRGRLNSRALSDSSQLVDPKLCSFREHHDG